MSFKYDDERLNEFERLFDLWNDVEYLDNFFEENKIKFSEKWWNSKTKNEFVIETRRSAIDLEEKLMSFSSEHREIIGLLDEMFEPLSPKTGLERTLNESKAKRYWLRIYALRVNSSSFIITGGAIKLSKTMQEFEETKNELRILDQCRNYLIENGITDIKQVEMFLGE